MDHLRFLCLCVFYAFASFQCGLVVTYWERADLLALAGDVNCIFVTFPCGILGQVLYLFVSFPDLCRLSYFWNHLRLDFMAGGHITVRLLLFLCPYTISM